MFRSTRLILLRQRKQELLRTGESQRRLLKSECLSVEPRLEWLDSVVSVASCEQPAHRQRLTAAMRHVTLCFT